MLGGGGLQEGLNQEPWRSRYDSKEANLTKPKRGDCQCGLIRYEIIKEPVIRQRGPCAAAPAACRQHCAIEKAFLDAETQWRKALASVSVADMARAATTESFDKERRRTFEAWLKSAVK